MSMCDSLTSRREKASLPSPWWVQLPVMEPMVKLGAILQLTLLWNGDSPLNTIRNLKFSHENKTRKITGFHLNTSYGISCRGISSPATWVVRVRKIKIGPIFIIFRSQSKKKQDMFLTKYRFWKMNQEPEQPEDPLLEADPSHLLALLNYLRPRCLKYSDLYNCQLW